MPSLNPSFRSSLIQHTVSSVLGKGSWEDLRKRLKEFTMNTQQKLEHEHADLVVRCSTAETKLAKLEAYVRTNLTMYQKELVKLRAQLADASAKPRTK
jgi:hypothetical protein